MKFYPPFLPYLVAIGSTAIALLLTLCLKPFLSQSISVFFFVAITISTWYGELRPGFVTIVLSTLAISTFFVTPLGQLTTITISDGIRLATFCLVATVIHLLSRNLRSSKYQIEQLSQQLLDESAEQLRMALSAAQIGIWNWNIVTGEINWSPEHEQLFGLTPGTFDGVYKTFEACLHPDDRHSVNQAVQQALQNHCSYHCEFRVVWANGSIHWIEGRGHAFYDEAGQPIRMTGTVMAINKHKQAQRVLESQFEEKRLVMQVTQRIWRSLNLQDILQTTVEEIRRVLKTDRVIIFQFSSGWRGTVVVESVGADWRAILSTEIYDPCFGKEYAKPFKQGAFTAKPDIYTAGIDPCHLELLSKFQVRANLVVPILKGDKVWGLLIAHHCVTPREWQVSEIELMRHLATQVSVALQQSELFEQIQTELAERKQAEVERIHVLQQEQAARAQVEELLRELAIKRSQLEQVLEQMPVGVSIAEAPSGKLLFHNGEAKRLLRHPLVISETYQGYKHYGAVHPNGEPYNPEEYPLARALLYGEVVNVEEMIYRRGDGTTTLFAVSAAPIVNQDGQVIAAVSAFEDICDRKQAEQALRQSEERYRTLFESIDEGFCVFEMLFDENDKPFDYRFLEINPQFEKQTGLHQAIGKTARQLLPNLEAYWFEIYGNVALTGEPLRFEHGSEVMKRWFDVYALRVGQHSSRKVALVFKDITARKQAELALVQLNAELEQRVAERTAQLAQVNERLLETLREQHTTQLILLEQAQLLDLAHDTIMTCDLNGVITFWNEGAESMYGWKKVEALGQNAHTLLQTQLPIPLAEIESELLKRGYWESELIQTRRDGLRITVASRWVMQKDQMGRAVKVLEINNDITLQKQAQAALQESEERRRLALDLTHTGFWDMQLPRGTVIWNDNHFTLLGLAPYSVEPTYELWRRHVHPDDIDWVEQEFCASIKNHTDYIAEYRVVHPDGSVHWLMGRAKAIYNESGQPMRSLGVLLDISDKKRIEQALRQSEETFRQLAENIQAVFWMIDAKTSQVLYVSPAYERVWQRNCQSLYQNHSSWLDAIHPDDRLRLETVFIDIGRTGKYDDKYRIIRPDGSIHWIRDRAFPITDEMGQLVRVAGIAEDITDQQKIEQIKNEFIGIVSHELRTPLTAIKMSLGLLQSGIYDQKPDKFKRMLEIAVIDTNRLANLVNDILDLERLESGRAVLEKTRCSAVDLMQQAVDGVQPLVTPQQMILTIHRTDAEVWAAADAIIQTLTNLLSNAIKFSPPHSTITLSAECQTDVVVFQVSDQGRGIPADKLEAIFGRFQQVDASDAREKGGTGLGLPICRSIIEQHGGKIWAESTLGVGSTFFFTLPLAPEETE